MKASLLALLVGCGSNQVSIGEKNLDAGAGGATGSVDAPVMGGSTASSSTVPVGGASQAGAAAGASAVAGHGGNSGLAGASVLAGSLSTGGKATGGATLLGGTTSMGGGKTGGSSGTTAADDRCGGIAGLKCPSGSFCDYGACGPVVSDGMGTCVVKPQVCAENYAPVCGCDGKTYGNDCQRRGAGVGKASDGACGGTGGTGGRTATGGTGGSATGGTTGSSSSTGKPCGSDTSCGTGEFCDFLIGNCGTMFTQDPAGTCVNNAGIGGCIALWQPVCGCDGKTYGNDCECRRAGMSKRSEGECPKADGGVSDAASSNAASCTATGGEVKTQSCCNSVSDFPDLCVTGSCGCSPTSSHTISVCSCPNGCFIPGTGCVGNSGTCTVGVDHSCNDNPNLASIHGRCVTGGRCVCTKEFPLLASGKCQ